MRADSVCEEGAPVSRTPLFRRHIQVAPHNSLLGAPTDIRSFMSTQRQMKLKATSSVKVEVRERENVTHLSLHLKY